MVVKAPFPTPSLAPLLLDVRPLEAHLSRIVSFCAQMKGVREKGVQTRVS